MGEQLMTTTEFSCGHQVNGSFTTKPKDDRNSGPIKLNYSMGKTKKPFICPQCEAKLKIKDLPEKAKANQSNLTR